MGLPKEMREGERHGNQWFRDKEIENAYFRFRESDRELRGYWFRERYT